jgi:hypothetical protein
MTQDGRAGGSYEQECMMQAINGTVTYTCIADITIHIVLLYVCTQEHLHIFQESWLQTVTLRPDSMQKGCKEV